MANNIPWRLGSGNTNEILQALGFSHLTDCDEIKLLKPWFDNIYPENILTLEEEEALHDAAALGFTREELDENLKKSGIDPNYLDTPDEYILLLEDELNALDLIDTTTGVEREVCQKMQRIVKELQEKDKSASNNLQTNLDLCYEQCERFEKDHQEICEIAQELKQHFDGEAGGIETFLVLIGEKMKTFHDTAMDILNNKLKVKEVQNTEIKRERSSFDTLKVPLSRAEQNVMGTNVKDVMSRLKKKLTLLYYTGFSDSNANSNGLNELTTVQSKFCVRDYAYPKETERLKTLLLCEDLAEKTIALKVLIPKKIKDCERKTKHLERGQKLLDVLTDQRELLHFVSAFLSMWNLEQKTINHVIKNFIMLCEEDYKHITTRTDSLETANQKFQTYVDSSALEEGFFPAQLWRAAHKFGIPHDCGLHSATAVQEQEVNTALLRLKEDLDERETKTKVIEKLYSEQATLEQEILLNQMKTALEESELVLRTEKEKHQNFMDTAQRDRRSKMIHLCWAYFLVDPQKLIKIEEELKEEQENSEQLSPDWDVPLQSSTPKTFIDDSSS